MTIYNESQFIGHAIEACLPYVDDLVIVEGAYQETIRCGGNPRSNDGTLDIIEEYTIDGVFPPNGKIHYIEANEETDKDQRNVGLEKIKKLNPDGFLLIIDGDEVYTKENFVMIKNVAKSFVGANKYAAYFTSLTFINDLKHYTIQEFPRLFRITKDCKFVNDNFMYWNDNVSWSNPWVVKLPYIKYHHYAFCKGTERFKLKSDWWNTRFDDGKFEYDWYVDEDGKLYSPNHKIYEYTGKHPETMKKHPLWEGSYGKS